MSAQNDGGPAFPVPITFNPNDGAATSAGDYFNGNGMSLRDWFAGQAINAIATEGLRLDHKSWDATAQHAYYLADAMLAARKAKQ